MDNQIEEIKNKLNILDVIGSYMKLTKTGINYRGICPFHSEKKPSFFVSPGRQMWHCFGCNAGSSIFDFVMRIEGVEFGDALRILANKAGVELKRENIQLRTERQRLYEICQLACLFFEKQLNESSSGREAGNYLLKRGITEDSIKKWKLGYSPDTWNSLTDFLIGKGYQREEIVKAGLAIQKEGNVSDSYDRFRGRIIFPVFDLNSQAVGFGGRIFSASARGWLTSVQRSEDELAKYINTPQTLIYNKSNLLYGLNNAKLAIRKQNQCVVTEGYTDVIMCHQTGFENTVAASGTALTHQQLNILKRYSENLILAFDADIAGDSATKRGISLAQEQGFNIKIIGNYLKDSDPADIILEDKSKWEQYVNQAKSIMDFYFNSAFSSFDKDAPEGKKEISRIILPIIKSIANKIEQSYWVQKLSEMLQVKEESVMEELAKVKVSAPERSSFADGQVARKIFIGEEASEERRKKLIEDRIVSLILKNPDYIKLINETEYGLFSEKIQLFLKEVKKLVALSPECWAREGDKEEIEKDLKLIVNSSISGLELGVELKNFLSALALKGELEDEKNSEEEIGLCLLHLKNIELKNKLDGISKEIKKAELEKDSEKINRLLEEFNKLTKEL